MCLQQSALQLLEEDVSSRVWMGKGLRSTAKGEGHSGVVCRVHHTSCSRDGEIIGVNVLVFAQGNAGRINMAQQEGLPVVSSGEGSDCEWGGVGMTLCLGLWL